MLDVVFPVSIPNAEQAPESLRLLERHTDVPTRVIVVIDGGVRSDFATIECTLRNSSLEWILLHEEKPIYLNACIATAIEHVRAKLVAFMTPRVLISDDRWFGKMQQVFLKDQTTAIVDTLPGTGSSAMYPIKRAVHRQPDPGCQLALLNASFLTSTGAPRGGEDPVQWWAAQALKSGGAVWHAGGVNYRAFGNPYILWRAPSAAPAPSASRSPTTPASSSRTTTARGGPLGFDL